MDPDYDPRDDDDRLDDDEQDADEPPGTGKRNQPTPTDEARRPETLRAKLGTAGNLACEIFGLLDAERLHTLTETYRERHGNHAWEQLLGLMPHWKADAGRIDGFESERMLEVLPRVLTRAEQHNVAAALWHDLYTGIHEFLDIGEVQRIETLEILINRAVATTIGRGRDAALPERFGELMTWLAAGDERRLLELQSRLDLDEASRARKAVHSDVLALRAELRAKPPNWTGQIQRRIRAEPNIFDVRIEKTAGITISWRRKDRTGDEPDKPETAEKPTDTPPEPESRPAEPGRAENWLRRMWGRATGRPEPAGRDRNE